jgi:hypothetical protein
MDLSALYRDDASDDEIIEAYQHLINTGNAWRMDGSTGRAAMSLIEQGRCVLGIDPRYDAHGNYVPSRYEVQAGTKGSPDYAKDRGYKVVGPT